MLILPGIEREATKGQPGLEPDSDRLLPQLHFGSYDSSGRPVKSDIVRVLRRTARTYNLESNERSAIVLEGTIRRLASQRRIPSTIANRAIYLLRQARQKNIVEKPNLHDWALSLLLLAARETRYIITIRDLVAGDGERGERKRIQRSESNVSKYFNRLKKSLGIQVKPPALSNYIEYFAGKLGLGPSVVMQANEAANLYMDGPNSKPNDAPHCVAAGALFISMREHGTEISQKVFCNRVNLSEISLRTWIEKLGGYRKRTLELPSPNAEDLSPEETGPVHDKHTNGEQDAKDDSKVPAPPKETERNDDRSDKNHEHDTNLNTRKERSHDRKPRTRKPVKNAAKAHKQTTNRKNAKINHR